MGYRKPFLESKPAWNAVGYWNPLLTTNPGLKKALAKWKPHVVLPNPGPERPGLMKKPFLEPNARRERAWANGQPFLETPTAGVNVLG